VADKFVVEVVAGAAVALRLPSSTLENQEINNAGPGTMYLGQTSGVTASTGAPFPPGSELKTFKNGAPLYAIAGTGTVATAQISAGVQAT
jgi:hypothetical protein